MDVTPVLAGAIAGAAAVVASVITMRQQTRTMRDSLTAEIKRDQWKRDEDLKAKRARRDQELKDERRATYTKLLDAERELRTLLASGTGFSEDEYLKWARGFYEHYHLIELTARLTVRDVAEQLYQHFQEIDTEGVTFGERGFAKGLSNAFARHEGEVEATRIELIAAMRSDVSDELIDDSKPRSVARIRPVRPRDVARIAVVSKTTAVDEQELVAVVAAVQHQISRDFSPVWGVTAELQVFGSAKDVPKGWWPFVVVKRPTVRGQPSYHTMTDDDVPCGEVTFGQGWSHRFSHECLETLASPRGDRFIQGPSPKPGQGKVQLFVQTCDPCRAEEYGYAIDGITVSNFCTPDFYDGQRVPGAKYDHIGAIERPCVVLPGGNLWWWDPDCRHMWMLTAPIAGQQGTGYNDGPNYEQVPGIDDLAAAVQVAAPPRVGAFPGIQTQI